MIGVLFYNASIHSKAFTVYKSCKLWYNMAPSPLRKRLTNEDKMKIIEESKQPGFCRKKTIIWILFSWIHMYFGEKLASQITFECLFLQMKGKVPYILQNNGDLMINAEFLFNLILHMMFRDKFVIVDYL